MDRIVRLPEVKSLTGMSRSTVYGRIGQGLFPRPISLGPRMSGWRLSEVAAINSARVRGASDQDIRLLVVNLEVARKEAA